MNLKLRTIAISSALCLAMTTGSALLAQESTPPPAAQDQGPMHHGGMHGPMSPDRELEGLTKKLNLSTDQQAQIKPILQDRQDQMKQIHVDASLARPDKMAKMKSLDESSNQKLEAVLTADQKPKYEKMIADRKAKMQEMREARQNGGGEAEPQ